MTQRIGKNQRGISTLLIVGIVVAVIVVAGIGAYVLTQSPAPSTSPTATPSATPQNTAQPTTSPSTTAQPTSQATATPAPTQTPSSSAPNVAGASSLQYTISATSNGVSQGSYTYYGKNIGTTDFMMRIEFTDTDESQSIYIVNGQQQKAWSYDNNQWTDLSAAYQMQYNTWNQLWQGYVVALAGWSGIGEYSYTQGSETVSISNIMVNPSLADSLFVHA